MRGSLATKTKSQNALEFLVVVVIVIFFFILTLVFLAQRLSHAEVVRSEKQLEGLSLTIERELLVAKSVSGNYQRNFTLPDDIDGRPYTAEFINGRELVLEDEFGSIVSFLPIYVYGDVEPGKNTLIKLGPALGICQDDDCDPSALFNTSGVIQCSPGDDFWEECDPTFSDHIEDVRVDCGTAVSATLTIDNLDDGVTFYGPATKSTTENGYFKFNNVDIDMMDSGWWDFGVQCGGGVEQHILYYLPYGTYNVLPLTVGAGCPENNGAHECSVNDNFTIVAKVECIGGECGDTSIYLDP